MDFKIPEGLPGMNIEKWLKDPSERIWSGPFTFVQGADPQLGMIGSCKLKTCKPTWKAEIELTRQAIQKINTMSPKPKFFIVCGDMLDAYPFEKPFIPYYNGNDRIVRDLQYRDFVNVLQELDSEIKLVFACGNHDIGDIPTKQSIEIYRNQFGPDYFTFWVSGVKFVVLNSQYFYSPDAVPDETEKHLEFMNKIADPAAKFIVVFQHIPFFSKYPEEEDTFNSIPKERRLKLLEQLWNAGVRYMFCGHHHKNGGGTYKDLEQVVTSAMGAPWGEDPSGIRLVNVGPLDITHEYIKLRNTTDCQEFAKYEINDQTEGQLDTDVNIIEQ
ncbi:unnamed protein product [Orchesella dallaii]|uniref:Calcineurin-like phosphoesterase domain-containing protein n=1 Tax=Orchesella dallaii TaxID=48710 RepID=A0ABP1R9R0_9HEXA